MKKVLLVVLIAALSLAVAAPSYASRGREAPATAQIAKKKCKKKAGAKKKKCKKKKRVVTPPAPTPNPLTDAEVINQVIARSAIYCADDPFCVNYGYYYDGAPGVAACTSKSTYQWACLGWNDENTDSDPGPDFTCDFREIVERVGIDGITSRQDLSFGENGWSCFPIA